jgi:AcrR family transcriptional regulator
MPRQALRPTAREAIVEAAIELLATNPGASLAEIAVRAGVGREKRTRTTR